MDLRCQPQWKRFSRALLTDLLSRLLVGRPLQLAGAPVPGQFLLERERTPGTSRLNLFGPQPQQQQIRHHRHGHRAFHPGRLLGDLVLPQAHDALQFLNAEFHGPSSQIECHGQVSGSLRQIGHEQFGVFGAVVTPPPTEYHRDISHVPQLGPLGKRPEDPATGAGHNQGDADLAVVMDGQMGDQSRRYWPLANFQVRGKAITKNQWRA